MSYPQAIASQEVLDGSTFYRLLTPLISGGDAYEMDVGALAFAIGPQSDLGRVRVTYYDPSQPSRSSSFVVSVGDPFIGRIDALVSAKFQIANTPARIVITPEDLYNNQWFPTVNGNDIVSFVRPKIDLLAYLFPPPALPNKRADFVTRGRLTIAPGGTNTTWLVVPFYRRKFASIVIRNLTAGAAGYSVVTKGINFTQDGVPPYTIADFVAMETPIPAASGPIAVGPSAVTTLEVPASLNGIFDYLLIGITGPVIDGAASPDAIRYIINTSDEV
jgi:hypothetical protein